MLIIGELKLMLECYSLGIGEYMRDFVEYRLRINGYCGNNGWIEEWSVFYWGWVM
ncbi:BCCT family transporter [Staphylococcus haemolyticus]|uniref:BCCT family transporter n=1 Tax=Staphylococcus haemolyticus TaxID=1283 RepID=UPI00374F0FE7